MFLILKRSEAVITSRTLLFCDTSSSWKFSFSNLRFPRNSIVHNQSHHSFSSNTTFCRGMVRESVGPSILPKGTPLSRARAQSRLRSLAFQLAGINPDQQNHPFATYPQQNFDILRRIFAKRRGHFMSVDIPPLPEVERVSTNIVRILGGNPSKFTLQGTNTYLLGSGDQRILLDTAEGYPEWKSSLSSTLSSEGNPEITTCVLTHWHLDHILGVPDLRSLSPDVKIHKHLNSSYDPDGHLRNETIYDIDDGERFSTPDGTFEIQALFCPGHTKDHMAFIVTQSSDPEEIGCMFTADNVLGHGTAVFEDLAAYMDSLHLMQQRVGTSRRAFPGHGAVIPDARAKLAEYIAHRKMREDEAMNVLMYGTTTRPGAQRPSSPRGFPESTPPATGGEIVLGKEWESIEMVKVIYRLYPENLWKPAEYGLLQVLEKLKGEGKVVQTESGNWKAVGDPAKL